MSLGGSTRRARPAAVTEEHAGAGPDPRRRGAARSARAREDRRVGYLLISPTVVIVFVMVVLPILWTVSLAFQQVRLLNLRTTGFVGDYSLENFRDVLTSPGFVDALVTTLVYSVVGTACAIGLGLVAALALRAAVPRPGAGARVHAGARTSPRWSRRRSSGPRCSTRSSAW